MEHLKGKRVVVIGGSAGIGLATAQASAREGASVVIASSRQQRIDAALGTLPAGSEGHVVDVASESAVRALFERIGAFDHLVFTAGEALHVGPLATMNLDEARAFYTIRYWGAFAAVKHGAPHVRAGGSIVLSGGIASKRPMKGWTVGASVCGAMEALTRALAVELAPIRVNLVAPGFVRTELWNDIPEVEREAMFVSVGQALLAGRVGEPSDLAETYVYLMRQAFSTGQVVIADGGGVLV